MVRQHGLGRTLARRQRGRRQLQLRKTLAVEGRLGLEPPQVGRQLRCLQQAAFQCQLARLGLPATVMSRRSEATGAIASR